MYRLGFAEQPDKIALLRLGAHVLFCVWEFATCNKIEFSEKKTKRSNWKQQRQDLSAEDQSSKNIYCCCCFSGWCQIFWSFFFFFFFGKSNAWVTCASINCDVSPVNRAKFVDFEWCCTSRSRWSRSIFAQGESFLQNRSMLELSLSQFQTMQRITEMIKNCPVASLSRHKAWQLVKAHWTWNRSCWKASFWTLGTCNFWRFCFCSHARWSVGA